MSFQTSEPFENEYKFDITKINPTLIPNFSMLRNGDPIADGCIQHIELFIPTYLYTTGYKSMLQFNRSCYGSTVENYIKAIELFGFISSAVFDEELDESNNITKTRKIFLELVREDSEDIYNHVNGKVEDYMKEVSSENGRVNYDDLVAYTKSLINEKSMNELRSKLRVIGLRLRISMISSKYTFAGIINSITSRNSNRDTMNIRKNDMSAKRKRRGVRPPPFYVDMNRTMYAQLCSWYAADINMTLSNAECNDVLWKRENPINPLNVFSIERSMEKARKLKSDRFASNIDFYYSRVGHASVITSPMFPIDVRMQKKKKSDDNEGENVSDEPSGPVNDDSKTPMISIEIPYSIVRYPYYQDVFELESQCINPLEVYNYVLPHRRLIKYLSERDIDAYVKQHLGDMDEEEYGSKEEYEQRKKDIIEAYKSTITCSIEGAEKPDIDKFKEEVSMVEQELRHLCGDDKSKFGALWEHVRLHLFETFLTIWSVDGQTGDSIKAIVKWGEEYLDKHANFCLPIEKQTRNLTLFEDVLLVMAAQQEVFDHTSTTHIECIAQLTKMLHVYLGQALNPNVLNIGEGDIGKSRMVEVLLSYLIDGTWEKISFESPQARFTGGLAMDMSIEWWDDVPASMFGARTEGSKQDKSEAEKQAFLKSRLTSGVLVYRRKRIDENGKTSSEKLDTKCRSALNICSNPFLKGQTMDTALSSRICVRDADVPRRADGVNTCNKSQIASNRENEIARTKIRIRMQRTQYLIAMIGNLIHCGLLKIDMTAARILNDQILKKASQRGLTNTEKARNYHFVECCERVLTIWKAVTDCFDSPLSEFMKYDEETKQMTYVKWKPEHIFAVQKYLVCTKEIVSIAFGFMENQFETSSIQRVKQIFKDESAKPERMRKMADPFIQSVVMDSVSINPLPPAAPAPGPGPQPSGINNQRQKFNHVMNGMFGVNAVPQQNQQKMDKFMVDVRQSNNNGNGASQSSPSSNENSEYQKNVNKYDRQEDGYMMLHFKPDSNIDNPYWRERDAIRYLQERINPEMSISAIENAVSILKKTKVSSNPLDDSPNNLIPALKFGVNCWKIATSLFSHPVKNVLRGCVEEVLSHQGANPQDMLYGKANETALFIFQTISCRPGAHAQPLVHRDYNFSDKQLVQLATTGLDSVSIPNSKSNTDVIECILKDCLSADEQRQIIAANEQAAADGNVDNIDYSNAFSKYAYMKINCDMDDFAIAVHAENCCIHEIDLMMSGAPVNPVKHAAMLVENFTSDPSKLVEYPNELELFSNNSYISSLENCQVDSTLFVDRKHQILRSLYSNPQSRLEANKMRMIHAKVQHLAEQLEKKRRMFSVKRSKNFSMVRSASEPISHGPSLIKCDSISQYKKSASRSPSFKEPGTSVLSEILGSSNINQASINSTTSSSSSSSSVEKGSGDLNDLLRKVGFNDESSVYSSPPRSNYIPNDGDEEEEEDEEAHKLARDLYPLSDQDNDDGDDYNKENESSSEAKSDDSPIATSSSQSGGSPKQIIIGSRLKNFSESHKDLLRSLASSAMDTDETMDYAKI